MIVKLRILSVFLMLFTSLLFAKPVSLEEMQNVAMNWMHAKHGKSYMIQQGRTSTLAAPLKQSLNKTKVIHLFPEGWVVVSTDDEVPPVLGYGESPIDAGSIPPGFTDWLRWEHKQIEGFLGQNALLAASVGSSSKAVPKGTADWESLRVDPSIFQTEKDQKGMLNARETGSYVKPLLWLEADKDPGGITWSQENGYNDKCPYDSSSEHEGRAVVGCVATAMGQIMRYYQSPAKGSGSHSYNHPTYGTLSASFGTTNYRWSAMPYKITDYSSSDEIDAVSTILYQAGVSVDMHYGPDQSGADPHKVPNAFMQYFGFKESKLYARDDGYNWDDAIQEELQKKRPLFYGGFSADGRFGHAFVLDGYDGTGYYHFNWGWNGWYNGFFSLESLTPENHDYSYGQLAVTTIMDDKPTPPPSGGATREEIAQLYIGTYGRAPDENGLEYWYSRGLSEKMIAEYFYTGQDEAEDLDKLSNAKFANWAFNNSFGRDADSDGLAYWKGQLINGLNRAEMVLDVQTGAKGIDVDTLQNKTKVALYYADVCKVKMDPFSHDVIVNTNASEQSVIDVSATIDSTCK